MVIAKSDYTAVLDEGRLSIPYIKLRFSIFFQIVWS